MSQCELNLDVMCLEVKTFKTFYPCSLYLDLRLTCVQIHVHVAVERVSNLTLSKGNFITDVLVFSFLIFKIGYTQNNCLLNTVKLLSIFAKF